MSFARLRLAARASRLRSLRSVGPACVACGLAALVVAVFFQVREHEFVNLDDGIYVVRNQALDQPLSGRA